jgi:hypothetical protein
MERFSQISKDWEAEPLNSYEKARSLSPPA